MKERAVSGRVIFDRFRGDLSAGRCSFCPKAPGAGVGQGGIVLGLTPVIQAPKQGLRTMRYELTDNEWSAIKPMLPNKPRGVPRVNDRRVLNGIFWVLRSGAPWRDLPAAFGPYTLATTGSSAGGGLVSGAAS